MGKFIVSFDLSVSYSGERSEEYRRVEEFLRSLELCIKPIDNVYLVGDDKWDLVSIRDALKTFFGDECSIFVGGLDGSFASYNSASLNEAISSFFN